jgi:hypothetical protein
LRFSMLEEGEEAALCGRDDLGMEREQRLRLGLRAHTQEGMGIPPYEPVKQALDTGARVGKSY